MVRRPAGAAMLWLLLLAATCVAKHVEETGKKGRLTELELWEKNRYSECKTILDSPAAWGHVYFDGQSEALEFYTSLFSTQFPCEPLELVGADPIDACMGVANDVAGKAVLVSRGQCSFDTKARIIAEAGGRAMILINQVEDNMFAMAAETPGPGAHENISSVMVRLRTGKILLRQAELDPRTKIFLVGEHSRVRNVESDAIMEQNTVACGQCQGDFQTQVPLPTLRTRPEGGRLVITNPTKRLGQEEILLTADFWAGFTGTSLPTNLSAQVVVPGSEYDEYGCLPFDFGDDVRKAMGFEGQRFIVLLKRGECSFLTKQTNALNAGVWAVLVENSEDEQVMVPGIESGHSNPFDAEHFERGTLMTSAMVFSKTGAKIRSLVNTVDQVFARFHFTDTTLHEVKELKAFEELEYWKEEASRTKEDIRVFIQQMGLSGDAVITVYDKML